MHACPLEVIIHLGGGWLAETASTGGRRRALEHERCPSSYSSQMVLASKSVQRRVGYNGMRRSALAMTQILAIRWRRGRSRDACKGRKASYGAERWHGAC